jgi:hypothetical protein
MEGTLCLFVYRVRALDDDPVLRFLIVDFPESKRYEVYAVSNGERASATFTKRQFIRDVSRLRFDSYCTEVLLSVPEVSNDWEYTYGIAG